MHSALLLGDSLFARFEGMAEPHINVALKKLLPQVQIDNKAVSGDNSFDLLKILQKQILSPSDWVFVFIGANDLAQHKQVFLGEYWKNLKTIVKLLKETYPSQGICLISPPPVDESKQAYRSNYLVAKYTEVLAKVSQDYGTHFISLQDCFQNSGYPLEELTNGILDDGLHFGSLTYKLLAKEMVKIIESEEEKSF